MDSNAIVNESKLSSQRTCKREGVGVSGHHYFCHFFDNCLDRGRHWRAHRCRNGDWIYHNISIGICRSESIAARTGRGCCIGRSSIYVGFAGPVLETELELVADVVAVESVVPAEESIRVDVMRDETLDDPE